MSPVSRWWGRRLPTLMSLMPALLFAMPAFALLPTDPAGLADTAEPGSVLVYPKFSTGSVLVDGITTAPRTEIELGAVCPAGRTCALDEPIRVRVHWVCAPTVQTSAQVCQESDFDVKLTVNGKVRFNPSGIPMDSGTTVAQAPCPAGRGYAIAWVIDNFGRPIKYDGLIGDAVMRNTATDLQSYSALAIQAWPGTTDDPFPSTPSNASSPSLILTGTDPSGALVLPFDGGRRHYQMVTGQISGDVRYDQDDARPFADTFLILLTLDVRSNLLNQPIDVALDFYNQNEVLESTAIRFVCWTQTQLSNLDSNLTRAIMGTPKGVVVSGQAVQEPGFTAATLLGLIQTTEGPTSGAANAVRSYTNRPSNNSIPVATSFVAF
jgi:hypothetical protein